MDKKHLYCIKYYIYLCTAMIFAFMNMLLLKVYEHGSNMVADTTHGVNSIPELELMVNSIIDYFKNMELELRNTELELKFPTQKMKSTNEFTIFTTLTLTCGVTNILEPK